MAPGKRTYRNADGQRIEGTWRPIFTRSLNDYFLAGLRQQLASAQVVTTPPDGVAASAHHLASWRMAEPQGWLDADMLLGEVADEIDRLNDRPDSMRRCLHAAETYLADMTEDNLAAVREAYLAIPKHFRVYTLGDMDSKDYPLRVLITAIGEPLYGDTDGRTVTAEMQAHAIEYFRRRERGDRRVGGPDASRRPGHRQARPSHEYRAVTPQEWDEFLGHFAKRKVSIGDCGREYGTSCQHEHACIRCPLLRPDPSQKDRPATIRENLVERITEAREQGWLGEVEGLQATLAAADQKLATMDALAMRGQVVHLGLPTVNHVPDGAR